VFVHNSSNAYHRHGFAVSAPTPANSETHLLLLTNPVGLSLGSLVVLPPIPAQIHGPIAAVMGVVAPFTVVILVLMDKGIGVPPTITMS
jgi:hypothetical protein